MTERFSFAAGYVPDTLVSLVLVACALLAVAEGVAAFRKPATAIPTRVRLAILALRLAAIATVLAIAFEVTLRLEQVTPAGRRAVVLVDRSASMAIADATSPGDPLATRQARAEAIWAASADARGAWQGDGLVLDVRGFAGKTTPYSGELARTLATTPRGAASDLARALGELDDPQAAVRMPVVAVVVVSDGLVAPDSAVDGHLRAMAADLGLPITTVSVGAPEIVDAAVADVRAGEFAFVENVTEIESTVVSHGLRGQTADIRLLRDGHQVAEQRLSLSADGVPQTVVFEVAPDRVGQFVYEVVIDPIAGEATTANNRRAFVVKVLRDKVRVLHVAGRPDWDVRALRTLLRRDPNVELLSYYILRGFDDIAREDATAPLSLIPFPTDELFEEELGSFDLVVLHNFDALQHQVGQYIDNIAQYVVDGGALVVIGGDLGLADGAYAPLTNVVGVDLRSPTSLTRDAFAPVLTEAGRRHPITAWLRTEVGDGWSGLPDLQDFNPVSERTGLSSIAGATLLAHPSARDRTGEPRPILVVSEPGKGRTMALLSGSTWRLGFAPNLPLIDGSRPYDLMWLGAIRWLLRDDTSGRLSLETDKPRYAIGDPVELQIATRSATYAAESGVEVTWQVVALAEDETETAGEPGTAGQVTTDGLGRARQSIADLPVGAYAAEARRALDDGDDPDGAQQTHEARRVFIVESPGRELARIDADPGIARLRQLAEATGGAFVDAVADDTLPDSLAVASPDELGDRAGLRVAARREIPLWNAWWSLLIILTAFGGEWILRRRYGQR